MKLIKYQVIDTNTRDIRAILGLDLEKASDDVLHHFVLSQTLSFGVGKRFHDYTNLFLTDREAILTMGDLVSNLVKLGFRGTPQGSVLPPTLFNLTMIGLSQRLSEVNGIYADDITIWYNGASNRRVDAVLQEAVEVTEYYLKQTSLRCSLQKTDLLLYRSKCRGSELRGRKPLKDIDTTLRTGEGSLIARVDSLRVLGMTIQPNGSNNLMITSLARKTDSAIRLIRMVANRQQGLREDDLIRLVHAFVMWHFTNAAAMQNWLKSKRDKLNTFVRKTIKRALELPMYTSSDRLFRLGMHNMLEEIAEAQKRAQFARLSTTRSGRNIQRELGIPPMKIKSCFCSIPQQHQEQIAIVPILRNVHPEHNHGRRRARAKALLQTAQEHAGGCYFIDAARYLKGKVYAAVSINHEDSISNSTTVRMTVAEIPEQMMIALALLDNRRSTI